MTQESDEGLDLVRNQYTCMDVPMLLDVLRLLASSIHSTHTCSQKTGRRICRTMSRERLMRAVFLAGRVGLLGLPTRRPPTRPRMAARAPMNVFIIASVDGPL